MSTAVARRAETLDTGEMIRSELSYLVPMRERAFRHEGEVPVGASLTNMRHHAQTVAIENARVGPRPSLDREGFSFETCPSEVDPENGTRGLIGKAAVPLLNGADHDEENQTDD
jgi:hypothetical protein